MYTMFILEHCRTFFILTCQHANTYTIGKSWLSHADINRQYIQSNIIFNIVQNAPRDIKGTTCTCNLSASIYSEHVNYHPCDRKSEVIIILYLSKSWHFCFIYYMYTSRLTWIHYFAAFWYCWGNYTQSMICIFC